MNRQMSTVAVSDDVFRRVYEAPGSLPGEHRWLTPDGDVRRIEELLDMPPHSIEAPLWLSGDQRDCATCGRTMSWLDIVTSALDQVHGRAMIAEVIRGTQKYVNTETPRAVPGLRCSGCGSSFPWLRSFKCHNWAYAFGDMLHVVERAEAGAPR